MSTKVSVMKKLEVCILFLNFVIFVMFFSWSMACVDLLSPSSLWTFDRLRKLILRVRLKRRLLFWHQRPLYKKWLLGGAGGKKSNAEREDSNQFCTKNPQEKEEFAEVTSKDQESESTEANPDPLFLLLSPPLNVVCSKILSSILRYWGTLPIVDASGGQSCHLVFAMVLEP